jgi:rhamnulokinase
MPSYLAVDLGAESGRVMLGCLENGTLALEELHRFPNQPVRLPTGLYWDTFRLLHEIVHGLTVAGRDRKLRIDGIGIDTWGVDFGLLGPDGALLDNPRHYRDDRTNGVPDRLFSVVPREEVFQRTGIQFMQLNSLYQLYAMRLAESPALRGAAKLLFMPDLLGYFLTGRQASELTIASTSQFYDPREGRFATGMLHRLGIPVAILPEIVQPGSRLGALLPHIAETTKLGPVPVYATACHDTAAAVAAVPAHANSLDWCYISSGTWSLMGVELPGPVIDERALALNFTNEVGAGGRIRFLKNIAGLWLLQECRRAWINEGREYSYEQLAEMAEAAGPAAAIIDVDAFLHPGEMPQQIAAWCLGNGQPVPRTDGEMARTILESLAVRYRKVLESLESLLGRRLETIHIVGGGSRHRLLNQIVANTTGRTVIAGPSEATAAGNVLVQAMGAGVLRDLDEARAVVRASFQPEVFAPEGATAAS